MRVRIEDIEYYLPEQVVDNKDLQQENPDWDMSSIEKRVGVLKRHIAREDETAVDLALKACERLFLRNKNAKQGIDAVIFCTQSEDYILPPNACLLHSMLDLNDDVFAFDFNLACSGYIYGLALAQGLICSKSATNVLLVNADTYSKYINKKDRSVRMLFGDGAAVSLITKSDSEQGIIDIKCSTHGKLYDKFIIPAGGCRMPKSETTSVPKTDNAGNVRTLENIHMDGVGILRFVSAKVPVQVRQILERNNLTVNDIDMFIFHQASKLVLDRLINSLEIGPEKMYQNLSEVGNTVSASIPMVLKVALDKGKILPGNKILLSGFGVGLSWGTAIIKM